MQASYGFKHPEGLHGRSLKLGEGISGDAGQRREPVVVTDLSAQDGYLGFWGEAERTGSLAALPIVSGEKLLGVLTVTRPDADPLTDTEIKLLAAIASNAALAIRNAQRFERMRDLSTLDELTGLANSGSCAATWRARSIARAASTRRSRCSASTSTAFAR